MKLSIYRFVALAISMAAPAYTSVVARIEGDDTDTPAKVGDLG
jgi:hypothetical protein